MAKDPNKNYKNEIEKFFKETKDENFWELYNEPFINHRTPELQEHYAKYILENIPTLKEKFRKTKTVTRINNSYFLDHSTCKVNESNREEENFVKEIVKNGSKIRKLGIPFYFQLPIKNKQKDSGGKIDLLTNSGRGTIYMVEVKYADSEETALRAILEIYSYYHILGEPGITKILEEAPRKTFKYTHSEHTIKNVKDIKRAVLFIVKDKDKLSQPAKDYKEIPEIRVIARKLGVKIVVATSDLVDIEI